MNSSMNIAQDVADQAADHGERCAFRVLSSTGPEHTVSYAELHDLVSACAGGLTARGITRGSKVVVFVPMSVDLYVVLLALFRIGAIAVFIDPWGGRAMIDAAAALVDADAFIGVAKAHTFRALSRTIRRIKLHIVSGSGGLAGVVRLLPRTIALSAVMRASHAPITEAAQVHPDESALITFTGGSTGTPKGADRTHGFLAAQHDVLTRNIDLQTGDVCLTNLPIVVLHGLGRGVTTMLPPAEIAQNPQADGTWLHSVIDQLGVNVLAVSPSLLDGLTTSTHRKALQHVRAVYTGGGPVLPELLERVRPLLPAARITAIFGSTEAEPIAHADAEAILAHRDAMRTRGGIWIGNPVADVDVRVIRPTDAAITLTDTAPLDDWCVPAGEAGELIVAGPHVNRSYFRNPDATHHTKIIDADGRVWHRTGDIVREDDTDGFWLLGRIGTSVRVGERSIWPLEVETLLSDDPMIARSACASVDGSRGDHAAHPRRAVVAIQPAPGVSHRDAFDAAVALLAAAHLAASIDVRVLDLIPTDMRHGTKIDMAAVRALVDRTTTSGPPPQ